MKANVVQDFLVYIFLITSASYQPVVLLRLRRASRSFCTPELSPNESDVQLLRDGSVVSELSLSAPFRVLMFLEDLLSSEIVRVVKVDRIVVELVSEGGAVTSSE